MCVRYVFPDEAEIERHFRIHTRGPHPRTRRSSAAPADTVPILELAIEEGYTLSVARWGLIPQWWKRESAPDHTFNAFSEEATSNPMWRQAYRHSRCLIPAEGWFESDEREWIGLDTREAQKAMQPQFVRSQHDSIIAFAGLMAAWRNAEGDHIVSCAVLTKATPGRSDHHDRMPVVVAPDRYEEWLNPASPTDLARIIAEACTDVVREPLGVQGQHAQTDALAPGEQRLQMAAEADWPHRTAAHSQGERWSRLFEQQSPIYK